MLMGPIEKTAPTSSWATMAARRKSLIKGNPLIRELPYKGKSFIKGNPSPSGQDFRPCVGASGSLSPPRWPVWDMYTQFAIQDSHLSGPNPWKNLSAAVKLPMKNWFLGNPTLGTNLGQRILAMRSGCKRWVGHCWLRYCCLELLHRELFV